MSVWYECERCGDKTTTISTVGWDCYLTPARLTRLVCRDCDREFYEAVKKWLGSPEKETPCSD